MPAFSYANSHLFLSILHHDLDRKSFAILLYIPMRLVITNDYAAMADWSARYIKKRINDFKPGPDRLFVLGLPTGMLKISIIDIKLVYF